MSLDDDGRSHSPSLPMSEITERLKTAIADRYRIERELGAGGMATVYLAHDVKHDRKVAVKVLQPELAAVLGAERFLHEIRVTANLQHPHILPLHDSGEAGGLVYYVMPFVEGESLRDKLAREKELSVEDAIEISRAVASALDFAHRHEVIHRDIKPDNILILDGQAMVADFGIALAVSAAGGSRLTETGLSLGTPQYMSPEQAMGDREIDARSDIYSLACVTYEMLTGEPPYSGPTAQSIVAKILTESPREITAVRSTVPTHVNAAVNKALAKLPADRFHTAAEFAEALAKPGYVDTPPTYGTPDTVVPAEAETKPIAASNRRVLSVMPWALLAVASFAALWGWLRPTPPPRLARFEVGVPEDVPLTTGTNGRTLAISPDGSNLAFLGPGRAIYIRAIDQLQPRPLPGTEAAHTPFFSADGEWVGFYSGNSVKKVALAGGPPMTITPSSGVRGAVWGPDDRIILAPYPSVGLMRVAASGGPVDTLTTPDTSIGEISHRYPELLPGGKAVAFTIWSGGTNDASIAVLSLETGEIKRLITGTDARYVETGHLVYGSGDGSLLAVPFDAQKMELTGSPVSLLEDLMVKSIGTSEFTVSRDGTLVYLTGAAAGMTLATVDRNGIERIISEEFANAAALRISPDGSSIAFRMQTQGNDDIWIYGIEQRTTSRLTFEGDNDYPIWTPDGQSLAFTSARGVEGRVFYLREADGSGSAEVLLDGENPMWEIAISPNGRTAAFREIDPTTGHDIWVADLSGASEPRPYLQTPFNERTPVISPDGRWLAYTSNESGRDEVYVQAFPEPSGKWLVSAESGHEPMWSRDGSEIYYRNASSFFSVQVQTDPTFVLGSRQELFTGEFRQNNNHSDYDIHPTTGEFILFKSGTGSADLVVVLNWFEELKQRVDN